MTAVLAPRPAVGSPGDWSFPTPVTLAGPGGLTVLAFDVPGSRLAAVTLLLDVPLAAEPRALEGIATILGSTFDEGTRRRSGEEFADEMALHGADYGVSVANSAMHVTLDVAAAHLAPALGLLAEAVTQPTFPAVEVARHVQLRLASIDQQRSLANVRASWALAEHTFAATSRVSRPNGGTPETVATITREEVVAFYEAFVSPTRATLLLATDLAAVDVPALVAQTFGDWAPAGAPSAPAAPGAPDSGRAPIGLEPSVVLVDRPGSVQSALAFGLAGPDRSAPDWPDLLIAAHALGGGISSRLMADLREAKGYTYGISARFTPFRTGGQFVVGTAVDTDVTAVSVEAVRTVWHGLRDGGLTQPERDDAVDFYLGASPLRFQTGRALLAQAAGLVADGLPPDWMNVLRAGLAGVTAASASAAFARALPGELTTVIVGDAARVGTPLRELGIGEITLVGAG